MSTTKSPNVVTVSEHWLTKIPTAHSYYDNFKF